MLYNIKYLSPNIKEKIQLKENNITYNNITYKKNGILCINKTMYPLFGKIVNITVQNDKIIFLVEKLQTITFLNDYYGYQIDYPDNKQFEQITYENLQIKEVFCIWRVINSDIKIIFKESLVFD